MEGILYHTSRDWYVRGRRVRVLHSCSKYQPELFKIPQNTFAVWWNISRIGQGSNKKRNLKSLYKYLP